MLIVQFNLLEILIKNTVHRTRFMIPSNLGPDTHISKKCRRKLYFCRRKLILLRHFFCRGHLLNCKGCDCVSVVLWLKCTLSWLCFCGSMIEMHTFLIVFLWFYDWNAHFPDCGSVVLWLKCTLSWLWYCGSMIEMHTFLIVVLWFYDWNAHFPDCGSMIEMHTLVNQ